MLAPVIEFFSRRWIGSRSLIEWPSRSPDLSPLIFFGNLKNTCLATKPEAVNGLQQSAEA